MADPASKEKRTYLTEEALEKLRERVGGEVTISTPPHLTEVTADGIRHWAHGIGDRNPFWHDEEAAQAAGHEQQVAPPTMILAFSKLATGYAGGLPRVHALYAGSDYTWEKVPGRGDRLTNRAIFEELREREGSFAGRSFEQILRCTFTDQHTDTVAEGTSWVLRTERSTSRKKGKHKKLEPHTYTESELDEIYALVDAEEIRGPEPRTWESVSEGDEIPVVVKGPLTVTDNVMFVNAWGGSFIRAHGLARDYFKKHPGASMVNSQGVPDFPERVHWDPEYAQSVGVPYPYDYGGQRFAWMGHLVTNWMGDHGFMRRLRVEFRRFNLIGDTTWCKGRVTRTYRDGEHGAVDLEIWAHDQRGEVTTKGLATVYLPDA
jgi:acyl dehydratase